MYGERLKFARTKVVAVYKVRVAKVVEMEARQKEMESMSREEVTFCKAVATKGDPNGWEQSLTSTQFHILVLLRSSWRSIVQSRHSE